MLDHRWAAATGAGSPSSSRILRFTRLRVSHNSSSSLPSSLARWRTSSSWRSRWPSASSSSSRRRSRLTSSRCSCARTSARASSAVEQRLQLLQRDPQQVLSGASPRAAARPRRALYKRWRPEGARVPRAAARSPRSSGSCAASCRRDRRRRRSAGSPRGCFCGCALASTADAQRARRVGGGGSSRDGPARAPASGVDRAYAQLGDDSSAASRRSSAASVARAQQAHERARRTRPPPAPTARCACWR